MEYCYLDHAATTPMRPEAVEAMLPFLSERFANPSGSHRFAREARRSVDEARDVVAAAIGCRPGEVVFTGGGTEADNAAVFGAVDRRGGIPVCSAVEHHAVIASVEARHGLIVDVDGVGHVDLDALGGAVDEHTSVVSVMAVNNEVGTITDLAAVAEVVRRGAPGAVLHTDAVQAALLVGFGRAVVARRRAFAVGPQVRWPEGRRRARRARGDGARPAARRRRAGA